MSTPLILDATTNATGVVTPKLESDPSRAHEFDLFINQQTDDRVLQFVTKNWALVTEIHKTVIKPMLLNRVLHPRIIDQVMNCITATILYNLALTFNTPGVDVGCLRTTLDSHFEKLEADEDKEVTKLFEEQFFVNVRKLVIAYLNKENL